MKFYDIYDALAYRASIRCPAFRPFKPALILPKGDGNVVYGMKIGDDYAQLKTKHLLGSMSKACAWQRDYR